jgi:hypothetical protein
MKNCMKKAGYLICAAAMLHQVTAQVSAQEVGQRLQFVACPMVRDTATVPCWLTRYDDTLYYMGIQSDVSADFQPPYLGHKVLVEGVVGTNNICGGIELEQIKISVMPELDGTCNTVMPAEDRYVIDFNPRPPGPSGGRLAFQQDPVPEPVLQAPFASKMFTLYFDFDKSVSFRHPGALMEIVGYAQKVGDYRVEIVAHFAAHRLSDNSVLRENPAVAQRRAQEIQQLLSGAGLHAETSAAWDSQARPGDGHEDGRGGSVDVSCIPAE